jgi:adenylate cyclase
MESEIELLAWLETDRRGLIPVEGVCTFGRTAGNTVVLPTPKISRRHAMIHEQDGEFWIVDLGSTNGVIVNGERITHPAQLRDGDKIQMPSARFIFRKAEAESAQKTKLLAPASTKHLKQRMVTRPVIRVVPCWILVADIRGFTKMSQQRPADEFAPIVGKWLAHCQEILRQQKGVLAKFLGDGFLAFWTAREGTASLVAEACSEFYKLQKIDPLPFRIVVHHGGVSFGGKSPDASNTMIGVELNFTFRLEKVAGRLGLFSIFSDTAAKNLKGRLSLESCGPQKIPDFDKERVCFTMAEEPSTEVGL